MAEIIKLFDPEEIKRIIEADSAISGLDDHIKLLTESILKQNEAIRANAGNYKAIKTEIERSKSSTKEVDAVEKQVIATKEKLKQLDDIRQKQIFANKREIQEQTKELRLNAIAAKATEGAYNKIVAALNLNIQRWKALSQEERENTKAGKELTATIQKQDAELKKLDTQIGRSQRNVGDYKQALAGTAKSLLGAFGVVGGITMFASVLKDSIKTVAEFDKGNATLAATLGLTKKDISDLTNDAINLGKVTQFTSTQVSTLQNELAKLGFLKEEIKASTAGILDLAAATDADLGEAAKVAGSALRAFGLDAAEMDRVVSVLAVATTKSALSFEDYGAGLSNVAPVAAAFGFTIEDTVALMGNLRDAGFDASKATIATRNIFLNMADSSSELTKALGGPVTSFKDFIPALIKLRESGVDLNTTLELTDKRSVAAFNRFLSGAEQAETLRNAITDVNVELADMVKTKTDNVIGAATRLSSAWEGLVLKFKSSAGLFKRVLDDLALSINAVTNDYISQWRKSIEFVTFGFVNAATKQEKIQEDFAVSLRRATREQVEFTIKQNEERLANGSKFEKHLLQMAKDRLAELEAAEKAGQQRIAEEKEKNAQQAAFKEKQEAEKAAKEAAKARIAAEKEANKQLEAERKKHYQDLRSEADRFLSMEYKSRGKVAKEKEDDEKAFQKFAKTLEVDKLQERAAKAKEVADERLKILVNDEQEYQAKKLMFEEAGIDAAATVLNELAARKSLKVQEEIDDLNRRRTIELDNEKLTREERDKINAKYDRKEAELKTKKAKAERRAAIIESVVNVAAGILKTIASVGFPAAIPLLIAQGALGAVNTAIIASQPIPKFKHGLKSDYQGLGIFGEAGRELKVSPRGDISIHDKPTLGYIEKGTRIYSNPETERILKQAERSNNYSFDTEAIKAEIRSAGIETVKAIKGQRSFIVDKDMKITGVKIGNYQRRYLDRMKFGEN